jgi:hypothetical protein
MGSSTDGTLFASTYRLIVAAMKQHNITRIIAIATISIVDPKDKPSTLRKVLVSGLKIGQKTAYQEIIGIAKFFDIEAQGVDWTICRVGGLANGSDETVVTTYVAEHGSNISVNRAAIARWFINEVESPTPRYVGERPFIYTPGLHLWDMRP